MLDAIRAELLKFTRHRATWGLVWIWPIGITIIGAIAITVSLAGEISGGGDGAAASWISDQTAMWKAPGQGLGRYLIGAFVAVVFAGEYGWNTWKLIVPHRSRVTLIAAKYAVALALLFCGFALAALIFNGIGWLKDMLTGTPIPPDVTLGALVQAHALGALGAVGPLLLTTAYVSLFAILTRSTVAALMIGLVVTTAEQLFRAFGPMLEFYAAWLIGPLYKALPGYHLANVGEWVGGGDVVEVPFPSGPWSASFGVSLAVLAFWIALLMGLTFWRFRRQDIN